jgi:hypothetical protein
VTNLHADILSHLAATLGSTTKTKDATDVIVGAIYGSNV